MVVGVIQIALVACLVLSLPLWRVRTEGSSGQDDTHKQITLREGLRLPGAKAVLTAFFCYCALEATAGLWASSYMVLHKGIAPQTAAKWASFFYLGITLGRLVSGFVTDRAGDRNMVRCGQLTPLPELCCCFFRPVTGRYWQDLSWWDWAVLLSIPVCFMKRLITLGCSIPSP